MNPMMIAETYGSFGSFNPIYLGIGIVIGLLIVWWQSSK
jgi:hypothetical protein